MYFISVPSQPTNLHVLSKTATSVTLSWTKPVHSGESIISYELYWNDTFSMVSLHIPVNSIEISTNFKSESVLQSQNIGEPAVTGIFKNLHTPQPNGKHNFMEKIAIFVALLFVILSGLPAT